MNSIARILKSDYMKSIAKLFSGVVLGQLIYFAMSPVLSRLYSPEDFGVLTLFMNITGFSSIVVSGQFDAAVLVPRKDRTASSLLVGTIGLSFILSAVYLALLIVVLAILPDIQGSIGGLFLYCLLPVAAFFASAVTVFNVWQLRRRRFSLVSGNKVLESALGSAFSFAFGSIGIPGGMVAGRLIGQAGAIFSHIWTWLKNDGSQRFPKRVVAMTLWKYRSFPLMVVPSSLMNSVSAVLPTIVIGRAWGASTLGYYGFTLTILSAPFAVVLKTIGDAFREKAAREYREFGTCRPLLIKTAKSLALIAVPSFAFLWLIAPQAFRIVFGEGWGQSGEYVRELCPMFLLQFICSPISTVILIAEKAKWNLAVQAALLAVVGVILFAATSVGGFTFFLRSYTIAYCAYYIVMFVMSYRFSKA